MLDHEQGHRPRSERAVELRVAPRLENLTVVRTLVGAVGAFEDLDLDTVADLRLAIDELCTQLIRFATPDATLVVVVDPCDAEVVVEASAACTTFEHLQTGNFSWYVLTSLVDGVEFFHLHDEDHRRAGNGHVGSVCGITLTTRRVGALR